ALGVRAVHRQPGEELGRHAATPAAVVEVAGRARPGRLRLAQLTEQLRGLPHRLEPAVGDDVAGEELLVDGEGAGVDVADRVDQAHHTPGTAQVEPGKGALRLPLTEGGQVEEAVAGE